MKAMYPNVAEQFQGDPVDYNQLEKLAKRPKTTGDKVGQVFKALALAPSFMGWLYRHNDKTVLPVVNNVLDDLKKKASKIGALGFCFGGRHAVLNGGDEPRVDCFVGCHASLVSYPKDIEAIQKPALFLCASEDPYLTKSQLKAIENVGKKDGKNITVKVFPDTMHGFAIRGNEDEEATRKARDEATEDTIAFFKKHLL
ncbi:hypothetical protein HDU97_003978 [Phlyctochytrium planicorne]|nr:hypothetical protein HDU97_003978 [Phlyctochytrium planicorne]